MSETIPIAIAEQRYALLFDANRYAMWIYDADTLAILKANEAAARYYGYAPSQFRGLTAEDLCPLEGRSSLRNLLKESKRYAGAATPCRTLKKDGTVAYAEILCQRLASERSCGLVTVIEAGDAQRFEILYRMLADGIPSSMLLIDQELRVVLANRNFLDKAHRGGEETLGRQLSEVFPGVILRELDLETQIREVFEKKQPAEGRRLTYRAPGVPLRVYRYSLTPMTRGARVELVMLLMDDVTEQLRLAEEIRQVERRLASVVESASEIVLSTDLGGRILTWNRAAERLSGYSLEELRGRPLAACCGEHCRGALEVFFANEAQQTGSAQGEYDLVTKEGGHIPVSWVFSPMKDDQGRISGIVGIGRDLTERRKFEQQLLQSQKLAALGIMAGGIAHEVRTPLAIASSAAQFLMEDDITEAFRKECAEKVHIGMQRASGIIENLLRFAHPSAPAEVQRLDLGSIIEAAISLAANQALLQKIHVDRRFPETRIHVAGIANLLEQVFLNLFLNALHAMTDGGTLTVLLDRAEGKARMRVADTGCGIAPADIDNIFDPFYTKAPPGRGTGLGLSICYSVIRQHGGSITVESEPGSGSTFTVELPAWGESGEET